jgi:hypothetical protein
MSSMKVLLLVGVCLVVLIYVQMMEVEACGFPVAA